MCFARCCDYVFVLCVAEKVVALYSYEAQNEDELNFEKDDIITIISHEEPSWWKGELNGKVGLFPSNYVEPVSSVQCK